jgi:hypothetical protein
MLDDATGCIYVGAGIVVFAIASVGLTSGCTTIGVGVAVTHRSCLRFFARCCPYW